MYADFWNLFLTHEYSIYTLLISKKSNEYDTAISIINNILLCYKLNNKININFVVGMRNGVMLSERLNNIELIISPMFQKKNEIDLNKLYDASQNINIPSYWSIIKYKFYVREKTITCTHCGKAFQINLSVSSQGSGEIAFQHSPGCMKTVYVKYVNGQIASTR